MLLIVGLGNPGSQYALTRHNIGFMALDIFAQGLTETAPKWKEEHQALTLKFQYLDKQILLVKPQTYMNLSGESVRSLLQFYKISISDLIVAHDDLDIPFASIRIQKNRGHAGHNGIRSISECLGSADYVRLKLGIGRPPHPEMKVADFVLQKFSKDEFTQLESFLELTGDALEAIIQNGFQKAATQFNKGDKSSN